MFRLHAHMIIIISSIRLDKSVMGRRSRQRGGNKDQIAKKQLTYHNYHHLNPTTPDIAPDLFLDHNSQRYIKNQLRDSIPAAGNNLDHRIEVSINTHSCPLLNLALAEVYWWNLEERLGMMKWIGSLKRGCETADQSRSRIFLWHFAIFFHLQFKEPGRASASIFNFRNGTNDLRRCCAYYRCPRLPAGRPTY
jgi:hypothetical protein